MTSGMLLGVWFCCAGAAWASGAPQPPTQPATSGHSAAAFYNAGNAEARAGHPALAVLDYERARLLAPTDADIAANLRHVREAAGLPPRTGGWLEAHARIANPDTVYWLALCGLLCAGLSVILLRAQRGRAPRRSAQGGRAPDGLLRPEPHHRRLLQAAALLGSLLAVLGVGDALATNLVLHEYVVLDTVPATGSPVSNGAPLFNVSQADVVQAHDEHQSFLLVTNSEGRQGWIARRHLAPVVPQAAGS